MPWKAMKVQVQRVRFVVAASLGKKPMSQLCVEFGISRPTGYLWLDRYREGGVAAIAERNRLAAASLALLGKGADHLLRYFLDEAGGFADSKTSA